MTGPEKRGSGEDLPPGANALRAWRAAVPNDLAAIARANSSLEEFLCACGIDPQVVLVAALALEEVVTNVIKYGYDDVDSHQVDVEARLEPGELVLVFVDDGHEFDPLSAPPPDLDSPIEERPVGGLGIHILRSLTQGLSYQRTAGKNVLTVSISIHCNP